MRSSLALLALLAVGVLTSNARAAEPAAAAEPAPAPEGEPPPLKATDPDRDASTTFRAEYPEPSARVTMAVTGTAIFAGWYGAGLGASLLFPDAPGAEQLRIPLVGPWMSLAHTGCRDDDPDCNTTTVVLRVVLTVIDGVGQLGGLAAVGEALFLPTRRAEAKPTEVGVRPAPFVSGRDGLGFAVVGAF